MPSLRILSASCETVPKFWNASQDISTASSPVIMLGKPTPSLMDAALKHTPEKEDDKPKCTRWCNNSFCKDCKTIQQCGTYTSDTMLPEDIELLPGKTANQSCATATQTSMSLLKGMTSRRWSSGPLCFNYDPICFFDAEFSEEVGCKTRDPNSLYMCTKCSIILCKRQGCVDTHNRRCHGTKLGRVTFPAKPGGK